MSRKDIAKDGKLFSKEYQPSTEAKLAGKRRVANVKQALEFIGEQIKSRKMIGDNEIDFTMEAEIIYKQAELALKGDTKAAEFMAKVGQWFAPKQIEVTEGINIEIR